MPGIQKYCTLAFAALLLLLLPLHPAGFNPMDVAYAKVEVHRIGEISATSGQVYNIGLNLSIPQSLPYQNVSTVLPKGAGIYTYDSNEMLYIYEEDRHSVYQYSFVSIVESRARSLRSLPEEYSYSSEIARYTLGTEHVKIDDAIRSKAVEAAAGSLSDIEKIAALAIWVNGHMEYDERETGKGRDSIWALRNKRGVCVDYTNLFLALARSLNYPARAVQGYAYSPEYGWQMHAWAEVYIGEWVGVDPTWLEVGYIDATHVPFYFSDDTQFAEYVSAYVTVHNASISWAGMDEFGGTLRNVRLLDHKLEYMPVEAVAAPSSFDIGGSGAVLVTFSSPDYRMADIRVAPCEGDEMVLFFDSIRVRRLLKPGINNIIIPFSVSHVLDDSYSYTCPVNVYYSGGSSSLNIAVNRNNAKRAATFSAHISKINDSGATLSITSFSDREIFIVDEHSITSVKTYNGYKGSFKVDAPEMGSKAILVYDDQNSKIIPLHAPGSQGQLAQKGSYTITRLSVQDIAPSDMKANLSLGLEVANGMQYTVEVYVDGRLDYFEVVSSKNYSLEHSLGPLSAGRHTVLLVVDMGFEEYKHEYYLDVFTPSIRINKIDLGDGMHVFEVDGPYAEYSFHVNGIEQSPGKATHYDEGIYLVRVEWVDASGNSREHSEHIVIGMAPKREELACMSFAIISLLVITIMMVRR